MICIFLADGFEETEALAPADILRRAGADVRLCGAPVVTGTHGIAVTTDCRTEDVCLADAELLFLPGGQPGVDHLFADKGLCALLLEAAEKEIPIAAICAAPSILGRLGLLRGKKATCFPGFEKYLEGAECHPEAGVVIDGNTVTGKAAGCAVGMGLALTAVLYGQEKADSLYEGMYCAFNGTVLHV